MSNTGLVRTLDRMVRNRLRATACFQSGNTVSSTAAGATVEITSGVEGGAQVGPLPTQDSNWRQGQPALMLLPEGRFSLGSVLGRAPYIGGPEEP